MTGEHPPTTAVLLAAGASRRMGAPKALLPVAGQSALERQIEIVNAAGLVSSVVVLAAPHGEEIAPVALGCGAQVVWNPAPERGMFSSVQVGVEASRGAVLLWPVDHALVSCDTVRALLEPPGPDHDAVIPSHGGRGGHPVLLTASVRSALCQAPADGTLRDVLGKVRRLWRVVDDPLVTLAANTPEEWQAALEAAGISS